MDGMLSQEEINALLSGMSSDDGGAAPSGSDAPAQPAAAGDAGGDDLLTDIEKDAIGEVANISMGTSATTLYSLVNRKVNITTPVVSVATWENVIAEYEKPCVFIQIQYKVGLDGSNILILKEQDVKIITDLMMGGDGTDVSGELGELHLSAISEAMNQMMGSSATSLSSMLGKMIDISPPQASLMDLAEIQNADDIASFLTGKFVKIAFRMQIDDDLVDSTILQLYPIDFAKSLYDHFINSQEPAASAPEPEPAAPTPEPVPAPGPAPGPALGPAPGPAPGGAPGMMPPPGYGMDPGAQGMAPGAGPYGMPQGQNPYGMPMGGTMPGYGMPMGMPGMQQQMPMQSVNIQPAQFTAFSNDINMMQSQENIELIKDVPLEVTVELGRTRKSISDILDFAPGTIVELDKIAGEPIDVLVNGKYVAKGEVVVIEESFGVRITDIIK
ncbi:MAG: flagellar motor switch phosphatase FliY [Lachnospiraceae bacterium]|nr:flagellar motor switch phosphatase FliY [Lachnospiraceae bacterium]